MTTNLAPPILAAIGNQRGRVGETLSFTASATDADSPSQTVSYSLDDASLALGMTIDAATGVFNWTPSTAQGGLTLLVTITVTDNGTGNLTDSETFPITVWPAPNVDFVRFLADGEISTCGNALPIDVPIGEDVLIGIGTPHTHYVKDGAIVPYTPAQITAKAQRPSLLHRWSNETFSWVDTRNLDDLKAVKWSEIKQARVDAEAAGVTWDGSTFDSDLESQDRIQSATLSALITGQTFTVDWTLADNTLRTLSRADMLAVCLANAAHIQKARHRARVLRGKVVAATSEAELKKVVWGDLSMNSPADPGNSPTL